MLHEVHRWFTYARWANAHMLDACATLDTDTLSRDMGVSFGSVLGTVEHMYGADWIWLERWLGRSPSGFPPKGSLATIDALRSAWDALNAERTVFLSSLDDDALTSPLRYRDMKGNPTDYFFWLQEPG